MSSSKAKLDMKHGFMKSIIRNQLDRDNYDKEIKAKTQTEVKGRHKQSHRKKPERGTYVPPFSRKKNLDNAPETSQNEERINRDELFTLEFEDKDGHIFKRSVYETDNPKHIAKQIGYDRHLSPPYIAALAQRIAEEIEKRGSDDNSDT